MRDEEKASGIDIDLSDIEKTLEGIVEKEAVVEEIAQNNKKKVNCAKVAEMRYRALENLSRSQKRQRKDEVENETAARVKLRRSGSDTVAYLREKKDLVQKWKMEEMQLQKQRLEAEREKKEQSKKATSGFDAGHAMQQQQSQIIIKLLEKQN